MLRPRSGTTAIRKKGGIARRSDSRTEGRSATFHGHRKFQGQKQKLTRRDYS